MAESVGFYDEFGLVTAMFQLACGTHSMSKRSTVQTGLQRLMPAQRICWKQNSGGTSTETLHLLIQESLATAGLFLFASNLVAGNHYGPARRRVHIKRGSLQVEEVTAVL